MHIEFALFILFILTLLSLIIADNTESLISTLFLAAFSIALISTIVDSCCGSFGHADKVTITSTEIRYNSLFDSKYIRVQYTLHNEWKSGTGLFYSHDYDYIELTYDKLENIPKSNKVFKSQADLIEILNK